MKKILVPIDESIHSTKALKKAEEIARSMGSDITILNIFNPMIEARTMPEMGYYKEARENAINQSNKLLKDSLESLRDFKGNIDTLSRSGEPASEIISLAEEGKYDLIVMGSRGMGAFSRALLGSVSDKVIHHAKTTVMIVK